MNNYSNAVVDGNSMFPSFYNNEEVLIAKTNKIERFQVIVFHPPNQDTQKYMKRVIGLPGEHVKYQSGLLYINGREVKDRYSQQTIDFTLEDVCGMSKIPKGSYFVLGDNRGNSLDSRSFGLIKKQALYGIVQE